MSSGGHGHYCIMMNATVDICMYILVKGVKKDITITKGNL